LRMNRLCYDEAHVLAAKITNSNHSTIFPPTPTTYGPSRLRLHMPSTYLRTSEISQGASYSGRKPVCCKYYPDTFNALRKMIISGVPTSLRTVFTKLITINTRTSTTTTWQNYNLSHAPQVTLDVAHLQITRAVRTSASTRTTRHRVVNTMPVQYDHLPVVNSATLFMDRLLRLLRAYGRPCRPACRHTFCFQCLSMIAANQLQRNCEMPLHSLSDRYPVSSKRSYKDRHLHRWSSKRFELHHFRQRGGRRCQDQRRTRRLR
jgi:hypothetical protein